jgi:hypothetical protein
MPRTFPMFMTRPAWNLADEDGPVYTGNWKRSNLKFRHDATGTQ